jgi:hypothetical protein
MSHETSDIVSSWRRLPTFYPRNPQRSKCLTGCSSDIKHKLTDESPDCASGTAKALLPASRSRSQLGANKRDPTLGNLDIRDPKALTRPPEFFASCHLVEHEKDRAGIRHHEFSVGQDSTVPVFTNIFLLVRVARRTCVADIRQFSGTAGTSLDAMRPKALSPHANRASITMSSDTSVGTGLLNSARTLTPNSVALLADSHLPAEHHLVSLNTSRQYRRR